MIITADIVEAFLKCPTKCYLRSVGEVGAGNACADWFRIQKESCRSAAIKRLTQGASLVFANGLRFNCKNLTSNVPVYDLLAIDSVCPEKWLRTAAMPQGHESPAPIRTVRSANFMRRSSSMTDGVNPGRNHVESLRCTNVLRIESFPVFQEDLLAAAAI
jgi:hypothetical protein